MKDFSVTDEKQALKLASKPAYVNQKIFNENLVVGHKIKETLKLKKLRYDGMVILDLSKTLDYNYITKKIYGDKANLLFTDTDSQKQKICMKIFGKPKIDLTIVIILKLITPTTKQTKKVITKFKDEPNTSQIIKEFIGLRNKMYS